MRGGNKTIEGMRAFKEWAVRVATERHNPDWVMPLNSEDPGTELAFTMEAYEYYRTHTLQELPEVDEKQLQAMLEKSEHTHKGPKFLRNIRLSMLPLHPSY